MRPVLAILAWLMLSPGAVAAVAPSPGPLDPRIRTVVYDPNQVVLVRGTLGYAITVEFGPGEKIENVSIGDGLGWQITPNRRANLLFLKPVDHASPTDMTVVTNARRYNFDLRVDKARPKSNASLIFALRFEYPEMAQAVLAPVAPQEAPPAPQPPLQSNTAYSFKGVAKGLPTTVFDDGQATYFRFDDQTDYPAIFAVDDDGKEAVVNVSYRDNYLVVDRLAAGFTLRRGAEVTQIINDGYRMKAAAPSQLQPASKRKKP
jgi:type IV secretion system protein VirB9